MQFGSRRAAGPSDGGLGEAGGGPWTPASSVRAEEEGGQGGLGEGSRGEGGTRTEAACGSEA